MEKITRIIRGVDVVMGKAFCAISVVVVVGIVFVSFWWAFHCLGKAKPGYYLGKTKA